MAKPIIDFGDGDKVVTTSTNQNDNHDNDNHDTDVDNGDDDDDHHDGDDDKHNSDNNNDDDKHDLNNDNEDKDKDKDKDEDKDKDKDKDNNDDKDKFELTPGQVIEIEENDKVIKYTVDNNGNLLNDKGEIFKEAKDVQDYLKSYSVNNNDDNNGNNEFDVNSIIEKVGIDIVDDKNNKVTYNNDADGIASYVKDVIENQKKDIAEASLNAFFAKYPIFQDALNYYIANGNSLDGFGEIKDRSNINVDDADELQQENIIRTAWKEQGRAGDIDSYIAYLKSSGNLLSVAKVELEAIKNSDKAHKQELADKAKKEQEEAQQQFVNYWNGVKEVIKNRKIAGYNIPDSIIVQRDGSKISVTPDDFFDYLYNVDTKGNSKYTYDLAKLTPEQRRDDEILRAYLMFTGGSYADLVKMAINEEKVKTIRLVAANNKSTKTTRFTNKPGNRNTKIDLGYN